VYYSVYVERKNVMMDNALWQQIDDTADKLNVSRSEWLREAARKELAAEQ